jgi:hypothetical protein
VIGLDLDPSELAATVMRTGKPTSLGGPEKLVLKRSLVNDNQRLEICGFSALRLGWYKAQGCFTEIIRYRTRLFVPVDIASAVLARLRGDSCSMGAAGCREDSSGGTCASDRKA